MGGGRGGDKGRGGKGGNGARECPHQGGKTIGGGSTKVGIRGKGESPK